MPLLRVEDIEILKVFREATQWDKDGEVVLRSGRETARVYFTGGKIAWAIVSSNKRTFTRYLVEHSPLEEEEVQEVFRECQNTKKNLAETVIAWELLDEDTVRRLLLEHLSECLLEIFSWKKIEAMFMPEGRKYEHGLTYDFSEVLDMLAKFDVDGMLPFGRMDPSEVLAELDKAAANSRVLGRDLTFVPRQGPGGGNRLAIVLGVILILLLGAAGGAAWTFRAELFGLQKEAARPVSPPAGAQARVRMPDGGPTGDGAASAGPKGDAEAKDAADGGNGSTPAGAKPARAADPDGGSAGIAAASGGQAGSLTVISDPPAAIVYLDGIHSGQPTPHTFRDLAPGSRHVVLVAPRGRNPAFAQVVIAAAGETRVELTAKRSGKAWSGFSTIELDSTPPGALIVYNKKMTPKRTPAILKLPLNKPSRLGLELAGHESWNAIVRPVPGEELVIAVELKKP